MLVANIVDDIEVVLRRLNKEGFIVRVEGVDEEVQKLVDSQSGFLDLLLQDRICGWGSFYDGFGPQGVLIKRATWTSSWSVVSWKYNRVRRTELSKRHKINHADVPRPSPEPAHVVA